VLFVGSSSIRCGTSLESQFDARPVVLKRGFGGSKLSDCVQNLGRLVIRYRPRMVLVYAGDNDLASGSDARGGPAALHAFVNGGSSRAAANAHRVHLDQAEPGTQHLLPRIRATNALIRAYCRPAPDLGYIDVFTPMLDHDGQPRAGTVPRGCAATQCHRLRVVESRHRAVRASGFAMTAEAGADRRSRLIRPRERITRAAFRPATRCPVQRIAPGEAPRRGAARNETDQQVRAEHRERRLPEGGQQRALGPLREGPRVIDHQTLPAQRSREAQRAEVPLVDGVDQPWRPGGT
jgi:hypothetical protein